MPTPSLFFRLLDSPIDSKGADLLQQIALQNQGEQSKSAFLVTPKIFSNIPGSPFAYWVNLSIAQIFQANPSFESKGRVVKIGLSTSDNFRFLRLWWECLPKKLLSNWIPLSKGGEYSQYYRDIPLVINWHNNGQEIKEWVVNNPTDPGTSHWSRRIANSDFYFRHGLTYPLRTQKGLNVRALPAKCIFSHKGPAIFSDNDREIELLSLLSVMNSAPFKRLVQLKMVFGSFEVGVIQQTPIPERIKDKEIDLSHLAIICHDLVRYTFKFDETTHVFHTPVIISNNRGTLAERVLSIVDQDRSRLRKIEAIQIRIDALVSEMYGIEVGEKQPDLDESSTIPSSSLYEQNHQVPDDDEEEEGATIIDSSSQVSDLIMWSLGVAFGRWDARFAFSHDLLPALAGPFDPLPRCSPGMLLSPDGLPATKGKIVSEAWHRARPDVLTLPKKVDGPETISDQEYPLPIAWDGILVDDPDHPRDIVTAVRRVLRLIWKDQADAIEKEACQILEVPDLRSYIRDPRLFFNFHIRRYSKSRRKAPIYWLLQSSKRNYAVWLYYPRLNPDMLFTVGREYVDAKLNLETSRLKELQTNLTGLTGTNLKTRERQVSRQADLIEELKAFGKELDRVALLGVKPDLNDGVLFNIAPLYNLVPWKEAEKAWKELVSGKYEWSSIAQQLQQKGWVKK